MTGRGGRPPVVLWRETLRGSGEDSNTKLTGIMLSTSMSSAGKNGAPGNEVLADWCSSSIPSVKRGIAQLRLGGWVHPTANVGGGRGLTVVYEIRFPTPKGAHPDPVSEPVSHSKRAHPDPVSEPVSDRKGDHTGTERGSHGHRKGIAVSPPIGKELELLETTLIASPPAKPRRTDPIWDTLVDVCGINPDEIPKSSRGAINKAVAELRGVKATPAMIRERAAEYQHRFDHAALTAPALVKHWASLGQTTTKHPTIVKTPAAAAEWLARQTGSHP